MAGNWINSAILLGLACNSAGHTLLVRHTLHLPGAKYYSTVVVLMAEILKLELSLFMLLRQKQWNFNSWRQAICTHIFEEYPQLLKMSVPAFIYSLQNNLAFIGLYNLDAATFQVTSQLKILASAVFMVLLLKKHFFLHQWISLVMLFFGVIFVQQDFQLHKTGHSANQNYLLGLVVVLISSIGSGFAGVYFEKILKNKTTSFWLNNMDMYLWGIIFTAIEVVFRDLHSIQKNGLFFGFNSLILIVTAMAGAGGVFASLVIHRLNNIWKSFAAAAAIVFSALGSSYLFGNELGLNFRIGTALVCISLFLFNKS